MQVGTVVVAVSQCLQLYHQSQLNILTVANYRVTAVLHVEYPCVKERRYIRGHTIPIFNKVTEILCARTVVLNAFAVLMKHLF